MAGRYIKDKNRKPYSQRNKAHPRTFSPNNVFVKKVEKYIYGNFPFYYGYRNQDSSDNRLTLMKREWLTGKAVLDIGCNAGHVTLAIARDFSPKFIVGTDIDEYLIRVAKKNTVYYINEDLGYSVHPIACISKYGPVAAGVLENYTDFQGRFPYNVTFVQENYVLESDELLSLQQPQFDTVLCLSITKWIHLNWGDDGIRRMFLRIFAHLKPGGFLILEAQPYSSYRKKKKLSESIRENFAKIKLMPEQFNEYLLNVVGFESCELIDTPAHSAKGFQRPIYLFRKADGKPKHIFFDKSESGPDPPHSSDSEESDFSHCEELSD